MWFFGKKKKEKKVERKDQEIQEEKVSKEQVEQEKTETKTSSKSMQNKVKTEKTCKSKAKDEKEEEVEEKQKKAVYRVIFDKEDKLWKIKKDGAKRVIDSKKTKEEALERVQELSKSQDSSFVVYKKDGKFQKKANLKLKNNDE